MRVAVVHSFYRSGSPSGENSVVRQQVECLSKAGHEVLLVSRDSDTIQGHGLRTVKAGLDVATRQGASPLQELRLFRPDVVHVHNLFPGFGHQWLVAWSGPIVATVHNFRSVCANALLFREGETCIECPDFGSQRALVHRCYRDSFLATLPLAISSRGGVKRNPLFRRADGMVLLSPAARDRFEAFGLDPSRAHIIPNGVSQLAASAGASASRDRWLFVGRLSQEKGILELIESWPADERLEVIGDGPLLEQVRAASRARSGIQLLGSLAHASVRERMRKAIGLVFPSICFEMQPTVVSEALSASLPIVGSDRNSVAQLIAQHEAGSVYGRDRSLAEALSDVRRRWKSLSLAAATWYNEELTEDAWLRKIQVAYSTVIQAREAQS